VVAGSFLTNIPNDLTPQELAAIKKGTIFKGMSKRAAQLELGLPREENDWGQGGEQLIYSNNVMIYIDNQEKVVDWQILNK
jgi:hypothetical protein